VADTAAVGADRATPPVGDRDPGAAARHHVHQCREGDRLTVVEEVVSVSPEKRTKLGVGHFVETMDTFARQDGAVVAKNRNTLFRFTPDPLS
jgi:hypothetical protein